MTLKVAFPSAGGCKSELMSQSAVLARFIAECHHELKFCCFGLLLVAAWARVKNNGMKSSAENDHISSNEHEMVGRTPQRERAIAQDGFEPGGLACRHCQRKATALWMKRWKVVLLLFMWLWLEKKGSYLQPVSCFLVFKIVAAHKDSNIAKLITNKSYRQGFFWQWQCFPTLLDMPFLDGTNGIFKVSDLC